MTFRNKLQDSATRTNAVQQVSDQNYPYGWTENYFHNELKRRYAIWSKLSDIATFKKEMLDAINTFRSLDEKTLRKELDERLYLLDIAQKQKLEDNADDYKAFLNAIPYVLQEERNFIRSILDKNQASKNAVVSYAISEEQPIISSNRESYDTATNMIAGNEVSSTRSGITAGLLCFAGATVFAVSLAIGLASLGIIPAATLFGFAIGAAVATKIAAGVGALGGLSAFGLGIFVGQKRHHEVEMQAVTNQRPACA